MSNFWLIAMNIKKCSFEDLKHELEKNGGFIMWEAPGKPVLDRFGKHEIKKRGIVTQIKIGDEVYFYVCGLGKGNKSRVLLRGEILQEPSPVPKNKVWHNSTDDEMVYGFSIGKLRTLNEERLKECFSNTLADLNDKIENSLEKIPYHPQGNRWLNSIKGNLSESVINVLKNSLDTNLDDGIDILTHIIKCFLGG